ncbi:MAG: hypothetical protein JJU46_11530 [Balneolaceae bacterium]|nr:hypothetical protein [Balneolaceae bacterium]
MLWATPALHAQTSIQGNILSIDGTNIPVINISVSQVGQRNIFSSYPDVEPEENGSFHIELNEPGYFNLRIDAVFHHSVTIPVLVTNQPEMEMKIRLVPIPYNSGRYFDLPDHLKWTRAKGNFNNYSFQNGYEFNLDDDGAISTYIPVTADTVRYQVRGLTSGPAPLPIADEYRRVDNNQFEALLYNDLPADSILLRYHPDEEWPFRMHRNNSGGNNSLPVRAYLSFAEPENELWVKPLSWSHMFFSNVRFQDLGSSDAVPKEDVDADLESGSMFGEVYLREVLDEIYTYLDNNGLHPQQEIALLISYVHLLNRLERYAEYRELVDGEVVEVFFDPEIIESIPEKVSPAHPMWNRVSYLPSYLFQIGGKTVELEEYLFEIASLQENDFVVRNAVLALIDHKSERYDTLEEMPVYNLILERYGRSNLAQLAQRTFEKSQNSDSD